MAVAPHEAVAAQAQAVRAAAAQAETRHLAVAACGPAVLVAAAERAVAAARKELRGVRLDFSGADPRW